jgi:hypothetical protein
VGEEYRNKWPGSLELLPVSWMPDHQGERGTCDAGAPTAASGKVPELLEDRLIQGSCRIRGGTTRIRKPSSRSRGIGRALLRVALPRPVLLLGGLLRPSSVLDILLA